MGWYYFVYLCRLQCLPLSVLNGVDMKTVFFIPYGIAVIIVPFAFFFFNPRKEIACLLHRMLVILWIVSSFSVSPALCLLMFLVNVRAKDKLRAGDIIASA